MITLADMRDALQLTAVIFAAALLIFLVCYAVAYAAAGWVKTDATKRSMRFGLLIAFPMSVLGTVSGFLTGTSREPAVSALVPAALTFFGLLVVYLIGKTQEKAAVAGFAAVVMALGLLLGVKMGASSRDRHEADVKSVLAQNADADAEFAIRQHRVQLGLPDTPPATAAPVDGN